MSTPSLFEIFFGPVSSPPENGTERRLAALMALDVVNYSALMGRNEEDTHTRIGRVLEQAAGCISDAHGRVFSFSGDGMMAEFPSVVEAMKCALRIQADASRRNADVAADSRIEMRIGVNSGDVVVERGRVGGDAVNIAARLEQSAAPGEIFVSARVHADVAGKIAYLADDLGPRTLKNIAGPVHAVRVRPEASAPAPPPMQAPELPDRPSLAVLPFTNMSGDPEQEFFADGVAEDVITALSRSRALFVIARNSSFTYRSQSVDIRQVGRELGVRYVLEGSVRRGGDRVRVTAQLIEAETQHHLWADRYDRNIQDVFAIQDEITASVTAAIGPAVAEAERVRALRKAPDSLNAWEAYQRGLWHQLKSNLDDHLRAQACFRQAIALDENFAPPHAALASSLCYDAAAYITRPYMEAIELAKTHARRALALDPTDSEAQASLAWGVEGSGHTSEARERVARALAVNPNSPLANFVSGLIDVWDGRHAEGRATLYTALRLNPHDPINAPLLTAIAIGHFFERDYPACIQISLRTVDSFPDFPQPYRWLAVAYGQLGLDEEARAALRKAIETAPNTLELYTSRRPPYFRPDDYALFLDGLRKAGWAG